MKACMLAATPGENQKRLTEDVGQWTGKCKTWMIPDAPPQESEVSSTVTSMFDGRYIKVDIDGEMAGMGPYKGMGIYGFDNVSQKFVATWIDTQSTGMMVGEGEISKDGKTLTWDFTFNCPLTKKPTKMREIETVTGPDTKTLEMFGPDPKTGKEHKMMSIELTRKK